MTNISQNKKAYLDYKQKLITDIKYYEKSIEDFRANDQNNNFYEDNSSDSDDDWLSAINTVPNAVELKRERSRLRTYLQATQELTGLTVLQFEVNVLVEEPVFNGEPPVSEAGTWREVAAECRADLVPFSITFFVHTPDRKFGQPSYRGVRVVLVKATHEAELANSVLNTLKKPSDVVEVLRSYAVAYRSRRTTLARLANNYTNTLLMEPYNEGGFVLKCANLIEVIWRLENKGSPVAPFHHKMKFDLEFMDESYIKNISQSHKRLSDPSIGTDERTLILAKIINTCLEAQNPGSNEILHSDLESKNRDNDVNKDSEVMAPPKSLPKKAKSKSARGQNTDNSGSGPLTTREDDNLGNDENAPNVSNKRSINTNVSNEVSKRIKNNNKKISNSNERDGAIASSRVQSIDNVDTAHIPNITQKRSITDDCSEGSKRIKNNHDNIKSAKSLKGNTEVAKVGQNKDGNTKANNKDGNTKIKTNTAKKNIPTAKNDGSTAEATEKNVVQVKKLNTNKNKAITADFSTKTKESIKMAVSNNANAKNKSEIARTKNDVPTKNSVNPAEAETPANKDGDNVEAKAKNKVVKDKNKIKNGTNTKTIPTDNHISKAIGNGHTNNKDKNVINSVVNLKNGDRSSHNTKENTNAKTKNAIDKNGVAKTKHVAKTMDSVANTKLIVKSDRVSALMLVNNENIPKNIKKRMTEKNMAATKIKDKIVDKNIIINDNTDTLQTNLNKTGNLNSRFTKTIPLRPGNIGPNRIFKTSNTDNGRVSKIPQKMLTPISEKSLKSNPLRISPRMFPSKFKTQIPSNIMKTKSIPRLLKKSVPKQ